jgi:hypothetical protein
MTTIKSLIKSFALGLMLLLTGATSTYAQTEAGSKQPATQPEATVTVSLSAKGVRFAAPGALGQMRLEVFNAAGAALYNSEFQPGTVRDWAVQDKQGQALADGIYLCLITLRDLSGRLTLKQGQIAIQGGQASLQLSDSMAAGSVEPEQTLAQVKPDNDTGAALLVHNGRDAQLVSTQGSLTFHLGAFFAGRDKELMRLTAAGNLGIGVKDPQTRLEVNGTIRASQGIQFADGTVQTTAAATTRAGRQAADGRILPALAGTGTQGRLAKWTDNSGTLGDSVVTEANGQIGIGTSSPASLLHLAGPAGVSAITLKTPGEQFFRFQTVANVANWGALTLNANFNNGWLLDNTAVNGYFFKLDTRGANGASVNNGLWLYRVPPGSNPHTDETPVFGVSNGLGYFAGSVGIGTLNPQAPLDVVGDMHVSGNATIDGNIAAKYQDVAEWVEARQPLSAGTVVVLDAAQANRVTTSRRAYDTHVAGVVSAQPGVILGQGGAGKALVATTGRVKVRVAATKQPIQIGDLLVTSGRAGVAMRSQPVRVGRTWLHRPGTIIGKALEPLARGQGEILVLLTLQ